MATSKENYKYLNWDADSISELLQLNLIKDGTFTDQIFPGSNLNVILDLMGAYFEMLGYNINQAASEAMFSDSQFYENINRISKLIRYNPRGFSTATLMMDVQLRDGEQIGQTTQTWIIPKYTTISGNGIDNKPASYTFTSDYMLTIEDGRKTRAAELPILYNGIWRIYQTPFIAIGNQFETFVLDQLITLNVAHPFVNVFVKKHSNQEFIEFEPILNLYNAGPNDNKCELRLNERRFYELKFGDGINGVKLDPEDLVYIVYLQSEGNSGKVLVEQFNKNSGAKLSISGLNEEYIRNNLIRVHNRTLSTTDLLKLEFTNYQASNSPAPEESVEDIRKNAPDWFRTQGTLVVESDYKTFVMNQMSKHNSILDVSVQNNFTYMTDFMGWLYSYGQLKNDIRYFNYQYATSCDFNNVYIWVKSDNDYYYNVPDSSKNIIRTECDKYKPTTAEVIMLDPLLVKFAPFVSRNIPIDPKTNKPYTFTEVIFEDLIDNSHHYISIKRDLNSFITKQQIYNATFKEIFEFFKNSNNKLGQIINIQDLYNRIMNIDGVKEVSTVYDPGTGKQNIITFNGLSMCAWTDSLIQARDFTVINGVVKLTPFQFPRFFNISQLSELIKITSDNYVIGNVEL